MTKIITIATLHKKIRYTKISTIRPTLQFKYKLYSSRRYVAPYANGEKNFSHKML